MDMGKRWMVPLKQHLKGSEALWAHVADEDAPLQTMSGMHREAGLNKNKVRVRVNRMEDGVG